MMQNDDDYIVHYRTVHHSRNSGIAIAFLTLLGSAWSIGIAYAISISGN